METCVAAFEVEVKGMCEIVAPDEGTCVPDPAVKRACGRVATMQNESDSLS